MRPPSSSVVLACALVLGILGASAVASARPAPRRGEKFEANKTFGLGLMLGAPTGLSGKYFLDGDRALDFGVGAIRYYRKRDGLHLHLDYLFHPVTLVKTEPFWLPLYLGVGGRVFDFDDDVDDDGLALGVRAPIGIAFDFNNVPLDAFFELAVVVDFFVDYRDRVNADLNGAIGLRYYFN
ncbi:MAG: hypothetical protein R2939_19495 [Kofleriaceae bacterium]